MTKDSKPDLSANDATKESKKKLFSTGVNSSDTIFVQDAQGRRLLFDAAASRLIDRDLYAVPFHSNETTQAEQSASELRSSEARFRTLVNTRPVASWKSTLRDA